MAYHSKRRALRNYRGLPPGKFHPFNQKVRKGVTENPKITESTWAAHPTLLASYLAASDKYDPVFHEASYGSRLAIAARDALQAQITDYLDQIVSILEAVAVQDPEVLLGSGFDLAKERRSRTRIKATQVVSEGLPLSNDEQQGNNQGAPSSG